MHETAIVAGLMGILERKAAEHDVDRILSIRLVVGRLRGLDPRQLRACFELFAEGTVAEGARLDIDERPAEARCRACGEAWTLRGYRFLCPACGASDAEVTAGRELFIDSFEARQSREGDAQPLAQGGGEGRIC